MRRPHRGRESWPSPVNLPNLITGIRLVLAAVFVWLFSMENMTATYLALAVFVTAAVSDGLDGMLARRWNQITPLGIFMDPFADKILVLSVLLMFVWHNLAPAWLVIVILAREFIITSLRILAERQGKALPAGPSGKHKMVSQVVAIIGVLAVECAKYTIARASGLPWDTTLAQGDAGGRIILTLMEWGPLILLLIAMLLSVFSGLDFIRRHRHLFTPLR